MIHILFAILVLTLLALAFGIILGFAAVKFHVEADPIVDQLDALLPQTQCGQCGYPGCKPYAEALANGDRDQQVRARWRGHHAQNCRSDGGRAPAAWGQ